MRCLALTAASLVLLARGIHAQQPATRGRAHGDSVVVRVAIVLAAGDPVNASYEYWIGRRPAERAESSPAATLTAFATIDTRQAPSGRGRPGMRGGTLYAPGLSPEEARTAAAAAQGFEAVPFAVTSRTVLGALPDDSTQDPVASAPGIAGSSSAPGVSWDPPGRQIRAIRLALQHPAVARTGRIDTVTIRYRASGIVADGDTVWIIVGDGGARRWSAPAVLSRGGAVAATATAGDSIAALRAGPDETEIVFAVGQRPGDARNLAPGFAITNQPISTRVQAAQGGRGAVRATEATLIAEVRQFGVMALDVAMPRTGEVAVRIVDLQGREVARIGPQSLDRGFWTVRWDGRRTDGSAAAPGVYLAITDALGARVATRLIVTTAQ